MQTSTLRVQATQALMRLKTVIDNEVELLRTLEEFDSRRGLCIVDFVREDLRKAGETVRNALNRLSNSMGEKSMTSNGCEEHENLPRPEKVSSVLVSEVLALRCELARSNQRLAKRETQVSLLIEAGLELAFRKEGLESEVAKLRPDNDKVGLCTAAAS